MQCSFDSIPSFEDSTPASRARSPAKRPVRERATHSRIHPLLAQLPYHNKALTLNIQHGLAPATRREATCPLAAAASSDVATCVTGIKSQADNAGLSEHLSELESRVEALHQCAEVHPIEITIHFKRWLQRLHTHKALATSCIHACL